MDVYRLDMNVLYRSARRSNSGENHELSSRFSESHVTLLHASRDFRAKLQGPPTLLMMLLIYAVLIYMLYEHLYRVFVCVRKHVRFAKCNYYFLI